MQLLFGTQKRAFGTADGCGTGRRRRGQGKGKDGKDRTRLGLLLETNLARGGQKRKCSPKDPDRKQFYDCYAAKYSKKHLETVEQMLLPVFLCSFPLYLILIFQQLPRFLSNANDTDGAGNLDLRPGERHIPVPKAGYRSEGSGAETGDRCPLWTTEENRRRHQGGRHAACAADHAGAVCARRSPGLAGGKKGNQTELTSYRPGRRRGRFLRMHRHGWNSVGA